MWLTPAEPAGTPTRSLSMLTCLTAAPCCCPVLPPAAAAPCSFALTENYLVLMVWPLLVSPLKLALLGSISAAMSWQPQKGTMLYVVDRRQGSSAGHVATYRWVPTARLLPDMLGWAGWVDSRAAGAHAAPCCCRCCPPNLLLVALATLPPTSHPCTLPLQSRRILFLPSNQCLGGGGLCAPGPGWIRRGAGLGG